MLATSWRDVRRSGDRKRSACQDPPQQAPAGADKQAADGDGHLALGEAKMYVVSHPKSCGHQRRTRHQVPAYLGLKEQTAHRQADQSHASLDQKQPRESRAQLRFVLQATGQVREEARADPWGRPSTTCMRACKSSSGSAGNAHFPPDRVPESDGRLGGTAATLDFSQDGVEVSIGTAMAAAIASRINTRMAQTTGCVLYFMSGVAATMSR